MAIVIRVDVIGTRGSQVAQVAHVADSRPMRNNYRWIFTTPLGFSAKDLVFRHLRVQSLLIPLHLPLHFPSTVVEGSRGKGSSVLSSQLQISDSITYILSYRHSLHDFFPLSLIIYPLSLTMLVCHFSHCVSSSSFRLPLFFLFLFRDSRMPFFFAADRGKQQPAVCLMGRHNNFGRVKSSG